MTIQDERDYAEEAYNRELCPECDSSPCAGGAGKGSCADLDVPVWGTYQGDEPVSE